MCKIFLQGYILNTAGDTLEFSFEKNSKEGGGATSHLPSRVSTFKGVSNN
jgi:hypothetical protein